MDAEREALVVDFETGSTRASVFPPTYGDRCGAVVELAWQGPETPDHPARLRAELTNVGEFPSRFRSVPLFGGSGSLRSRSESRDRPVISLVPTEDHPLTDDVPTYERGPGGHWRLAGPVPGIPHEVRVDPDESVVGDYYLLAERDAEGFPDGRYEFKRYVGGVGVDGFTLAVWDPEPPGPTGRSRFEEAHVPPLPEWGSASTPTGTAWYHEAGPGTEIYLRPSTEHVPLPGRVDFELVNRSGSSLYGNPAEWRLLRSEDGEWTGVDSFDLVQPGDHLPVGDRREFTLWLFEGDPVPCDSGVEVGDVEPGRYAFSVGWGPTNGCVRPSWKSGTSATGATERDPDPGPIDPTTTPRRGQRRRTMATAK